MRRTCGATDVHPPITDEDLRKGTCLHWDTLEVDVSSGEVCRLNWDLRGTRPEPKSELRVSLLRSRRGDVGPWGEQKGARTRTDRPDTVGGPKTGCMEKKEPNLPREIWGTVPRTRWTHPEVLGLIPEGF